MLNDTPMIDVRAPVEFITGALPSSANLPLMSDDERHQVGIRYKNNGQQSAIELGNSLVVGDVKEQRAVDAEGLKIFEDENPKYLQFLESKTN